MLRGRYRFQTTRHFLTYFFVCFGRLGGRALLLAPPLPPGGWRLLELRSLVRERDGLGCFVTTGRLDWRTAPPLEPPAGCRDTALRMLAERADEAERAGPLVPPAG